MNQLLAEVRRIVFSEPFCLDAKSEDARTLIDFLTDMEMIFKNIGNAGRSYWGLCATCLDFLQDLLAEARDPAFVLQLDVQTKICSLLKKVILAVEQSFPTATKKSVAQHSLLDYQPVLQQVNKIIFDSSDADNEQKKKPKRQLEWRLAMILDTNPKTGWPGWHLAVGLMTKKTIHDSTALELVEKIKMDWYGVIREDIICMERPCMKGYVLTITEPREVLARLNKRTTSPDRLFAALPTPVRAQAGDETDGRRFVFSVSNAHSA